MGIRSCLRRFGLAEAIIKLNVDAFYAVRAIMQQGRLELKTNNLKKLAQLLDFGADCLEDQKINILKLRGARKVLFPMLAAAQSYTEAVYSLCKESRTPACLSLLRSLCDNFIKAKFLYCHPLKHSHVIFLDGVIQKRKQLNHTLSFFKANPECLTEVEFTTKNLEIALKKVEKQKKITELKIDKYPKTANFDTLEMAKYVDKYNKGKNKKTSSLEWIYILIFRELSSETHINFLSFKNYFKIEKNEIIIMLSGNPDDVNHILILAIFLYKEMLAMFLRIFKSPLIKSLKKFQFKF